MALQVRVAPGAHGYQLIKPEHLRAIELAKLLSD
jgi:hypothetical protein